MKFLDIVEELQKVQENEEKIIIVRCGAFFVGIGKDALVLSTLLNLKTTCIKRKICKVGIPLNSILKYTELLEQIGNSFIIYDYDKDTKKYSLKYEFKEKGLPIGNYTSQCFANIYLNEMDQYAKQELKLKYWYHYMDDMIAIVQTKQEAIDKLEQIRRFLDEKLELQLNSKTQIFKSSQGVNFCGYKINEYRLKIRDKGKRKIKRKVKELRYKVKIGELSSKKAHKYLAGHLGYIKIANVNNLKNKLFYINSN